MKGISVADVRNFALMGHTGSGKTALVDAILHRVKLNDRQGSTDDGSSMADWTAEEKTHKISIWAKPFNVTHTGADGRKTAFVVLDTPGYADFFGQVISAAAVCDAALLAVDAHAGLQVGATKAWRLCEKNSLPRGVVITGLDKEGANFENTVAALEAAWNKPCVPVVLPAGDKFLDVLTSADPAAEASRNRLIEAAAEADDAMLERFLGGETLSAEDVLRGLRAVINQGKLVPVFAANGRKALGIGELLDGLAKLFPSPAERPVQDAGGQALVPAADGPLAGFVWRALNDPFVGQISFLRVYRGTIRPDMELTNFTRGGKERIGGLVYVNGRKQEPVVEAGPGEIVALAKLKTTKLSDSLGDAAAKVLFKPLAFPNPVVFNAVLPKNQADDDKMGTALHRVADDDPTLRIERNPETHEQLLAGMGDVQLGVVVEKMKAVSNVEVTLHTPKVAYKETVTALGEGHYKHKKQSGGRGQYGEVYLKVQPRQPGDDEWFVDAIVGVTIPRNFLPAVQKGVVEGMQRGALAACPVINVKATVYDGSYHDVDSSEVAFKIAGARAFKDGMLKAKPVLLEPIMTIRIMVPEHFMGEVNGDLNHRRGRILGMGLEEGAQVITAEAPQAELFQYSSQLRSMTGGQGSFEMEFARYDIVPANITQKLIAAAAKDKVEHEE